MPEKFDGWPFYFIQRYRAQEILIDYAIQAGVNIHLNSRVTEYFEEDGYGGIAVDNERHLADGVIAADGIHSDGRKFVTGQQEDPQSSGFAIYRCSFPLDLLAKSPATKKFTEMTNDIYWTWIDTDKHYILLTNIKTRVATVLLTHKVKTNCLLSPLTPIS
jgi:2-polyprenyl-6-methoxyphenol hydroxylase-like FAD-dependent oxidoreductase